MTDQENIYKTISVKYDSMDTLFEREEYMMKTLMNYLEREKEYEFVDTYITQSETKSILNLRIKLKN